MLKKEIIEKYNVPSPRYTSYPTILDWNHLSMESKVFQNEFIRTEKGKNHTTSVYIHLPFCESLCTFCGCHKHITKNHTVEQPYIDALIKEWEMYESMNGGPIEVSELYLGGGTPTFFQASELKRLVERITKHRAQNIHFSVEGHPNHTTEEQMQVLYDLGFRRISFGVQDYSPIVQKAINRVQTYEQVKNVTETARKIGYTSISHDLVFGLPMQHIDDMEDSIEKTIKLKPDTISLYSYAHVPWVKGTGQRGFSDEDLPTGDEKRALYEYAKQTLLSAGYLEIGMDHFGLPTEALTKAMLSGKMNRTFMGYTTSATDRTIGLGASAISEYDFGYAQNVKSIKEYHEKINNNQLPVFKGHIHTYLDKSLKKHILALMCNFETKYCPNSYIEQNLNNFASAFKEFEKDGILKWENGHLKITKEGQPFVRNVCMTFDPYARQKAEKPRFSKSV